MRNISPEELKKVIEAHQIWLNEPCGWTEEHRAYLSRTDLNGMDLHGAKLCLAQIDRTDLRFANLRDADLQNADLSNSDLYGADLRGAQLFETNLFKANLGHADLSGAFLDGACLCNAYIDSETKGIFVPTACPDMGGFFAWKKCLGPNKASCVIVKLFIPSDAKRSSATGRKCRADKALVVGIETLDGQPTTHKVAWSMRDMDFYYIVGEMATPREPFAENRFDECSSGIHFFVNRQEAVNYCY